VAPSTDRTGIPPLLVKRFLDRDGCQKLPEVAAIAEPLEFTSRCPRTENVERTQGDILGIFNSLVSCGLEAPAGNRDNLLIVALPERFSRCGLPFLERVNPASYRIGFLIRHHRHRVEQGR
jgi:hypothetical protein